MGSYHSSLKFNMKCQVVFVFALTIALVYADESALETFKRLHTKCQSDPKTAVKESVLEEAGKGKVDVDAIGPHTLCMNVELGMQEPNGDIDKDKLRKAVEKLSHYDAETVDNIVTECGTRNGATKFKAAVAFYECYAKQTKKYHAEH